MAACGLDLAGALTIGPDGSAPDASQLDSSVAEDAPFDTSSTDLDAGASGDADATTDACPTTTTTFQNGTLSIPPKAKPVTIDGNLDEWSCAQFFTYNAASAAVVDAVMPAANTFSFAVSWDSAFIYVAARVKDATMPRGGNTGTIIYQNDSIEVYLGNSSPYTIAYSAREHQYVVDWANRAHVYQVTSTNPPPPNFSSAVTATASGFDVELRVPASELGVATLTAPMTLGIAFAANEHNGAQQHGWALWHRPSGVACNSGCCQIWCDARYLGGLVLKN